MSASGPDVSVAFATTLDTPDHVRIAEELSNRQGVRIVVARDPGTPARRWASCTKLTRKTVAELATRERFDGPPFAPADESRA